MIENIKFIAFIALAIVTVIIIIVLFNKARKDRVLNEIDDLQVAFNELRTTPLSLKFNVAQAVAKRNGETDKEIKEYYSRYEATQGLIDEIDNEFVNVENLKNEHSYGQLRKVIPSLSEKVLRCAKEVKETDVFLKKYEAKDTEQRSFSTNLKQEFQMVRDTIRRNVNQLSIAYDAVDARLNNCSALFTKSEDAMFANDYMVAQETLDSIQKEIKNIKAIVNEIPSIIRECTIVIPSSVEEVESSCIYIKQKGIYIKHLNVDETLNKVREEISACTKKVAALEIEGLKDRVANAKNEVTSLGSSLANEDKKYASAKKTLDDANSCLINIANVLDFVKTSAATNEYLLSSLEEKPDFTIYDSRLADLKSSYITLATRIENLLEPASLIDGEVSALYSNASALKEELLELKEHTDKSINDIQRARASLIKFQLVVNQAEISVKASHLPSIAESFNVDLKKCKDRIEEIKRLLDDPAVDLDVLNERIQDSMNYIYNFSNDVKNLVGLSIMVENAIVFGNKFRSSHAEIDSDLSKSEFSFLNGEYTKAVQLAIQTMDYLYPETNHNLGNN